MYQEIGFHAPSYGDKLPFEVRKQERANSVCRLIYDCDGALKLITEFDGKKRTVRDATDTAFLLGIPDRIKTENIIIAGDTNTEEGDDQEPF